MDVTGVVKIAPSAVESCTQSDIELHIESVCSIVFQFVTFFQFGNFSSTASALPFRGCPCKWMMPRVLVWAFIIACIRTYHAVTETDPGQVNQDTRLDNRVIDLRTETNQAIFKIQVSRLAISAAFLDIVI